jgi:hypothetical protein
MSQQISNGLATLCIENKLLDKINVEVIINDLAAANVRKDFLKKIKCITYFIRVFYVLYLLELLLYYKSCIKELIVFSFALDL